MAEMTRLQIVTPDESFFDGEVSMVELNTADGEAGIYPMNNPPDGQPGCTGRS